MSIFQSFVPQKQDMNQVVEDAILDKWLGVPGLNFHKHGSTETRDECRKYLESLMAKWIPSYVPNESIKTALRNPGDHYRAMSGLQKAVRKGDTEFAQRAAHALIVSDKADTFWRRISMIALEDVGLADPYAVGFALALASNAKLRSAVGWKKAAFWICATLCEANKSRDLTHLMCLLQNTGPSLQHTTDQEYLYYVSTDTEADLGTRLEAFAWLTAGSFELFGKKTENFPSKYRKQVMDNFELPPLLRFIMIQGRRNGAWCLDVAVPFNWRMLCATHTALPDLDEWDDGTVPEKIGSTHAAALDQYTQLGKRAIAYFKKSCAPVAEAISVVNPKHQTAAMGEAVFYAEGGILRPWLTWQGSHQLFNDVFESFFAVKGISRADAITICNAVQMNLPQLHEIRRKFLAQ